MKVEIKNYQIIKEANLEFINGINAIVGSNNNGKSSIIRAIESAINNKKGSSFISYGEDSCLVKIEDSGHVIEWDKNKNSSKSKYIIDGEVINKIGTTQLDEVGQVLSMPEITVGGTKHRLNMWKQFDNPFLVDKNPYQLFDFISKSKEQELISELQDKTNDDFKQARKDEDTANVNIDNSKERIASFKKEIEELKKFTDFDLNKVKLISEVYDTISSYIEDLESNKTSIESLEQSLVDDRARRDSILTLEQKIKKYIDVVIPLSNSISKYDENVELLSDSTILLENDKASKSKLESSIENISKIIDDIAKLEKDTEKLETLLDKQESILNDIELEFLEKIKLSKDLNKIKEELSEFKVCPLCGGPLDNHEEDHDGK